MQKFYLKKVFFILFLDLFSFSVIIPLLPLLFLDSRFFLHDTSYSMRVIYLGLLYASYPFAQSMASFFWMKMSDRLGRKHGLRLSFIGNMLGYLISGYGVMRGNPLYLFIGNMVAGLLGINISTMHALISDHYQGEKRLKYFGMIQFLLGLAFAMGPFIAARLSASVPQIETLVLFLFISASIVALFNALFISRIPQSEQIKAVQDSYPMKEHSNTPHFPLFLIFLSTFGWYLFIKSFQVFLLETGKIETAQILQLVSFYGFSSVITQGIFVTRFYKKFPPKQVLSLALGGLSLSILAFVLKPTPGMLYLNIFVITFCQSLIMPNLLSIFSEKVSPEVSGRVMSQHLGVVSLAKILAPSLSGVLIALHPALSIYLSSLVIGTVFILVPRLFKPTIVSAKT